MSNFPNVASLVPHEAPMILVDNLVFADNETVHCQVFVTEQSPFFEIDSKSIGAWVGIEYMAQTISAWSGYQSYLNNKTSPIGFLLGSRRYNTKSDCFHQGDVLDIFAEKLMEADGMGAFACSIKRGTEELATAQLNVFVPNKEQLDEMLNGKEND